MSDTDFPELWTRQFRAELIRRRGNVLASHEALKNRDSNFAHGHETMLDLHDTCIAATDAVRDSLAASSSTETTEHA